MLFRFVHSLEHDFATTDIDCLHVFCKLFRYLADTQNPNRRVRGGWNEKDHSQTIGQANTIINDQFRQVRLWNRAPCQIKYVGLLRGPTSAVSIFGESILIAGNIEVAVNVSLEVPDDIPELSFRESLYSVSSIYRPRGGIL